jgi:hypothetical protein
MDRNVIRTTTTARAQDIITRGHTVTAFPHGQCAAAAARASTARVEVAHAEDDVIAAHVQGTSAEVGAATDHDQVTTAADHGQDIARVKAGAAR